MHRVWQTCNFVRDSLRLEPARLRTYALGGGEAEAVEKGDQCRAVGSPKAKALVPGAALGRRVFEVGRLC